MASPIKFVRDPMYGLQKIADDDEFSKIVTIALDQYKKLDIPERECTYRDTIIKLKDDKIHPASLAKLSIKYPDLKIATDIKYVIPKLPEEEKIILLPPNANELISFYNLAGVGNREFNVDCKATDAAYWLSFFCAYDEEFCATYEEYITNPDLGVGMIEDKTKYRESSYKTTKRRVNTTMFDIKATCHLILISMHKSFSIVTAERDRQIKNYLANRKSAVYSSMGVPVGDLCLKDEFFLDLSDVFKILPKLRRTLFFFCYQNQTYPEFGTACVLLAHSAMTTIKAIFDFISLERKTLAHSEPVMLEEIHKFITVTNKKKDADGALWPYHRILYPADGDLNAANFPNLAVCSIEYYKAHGSETFKYMVTPSVPTAPGLRDKCIKHDTRDIYKQREKATLSEAAKSGAKELGLDIDRLLGTQAAQKRAEVNSDIMEILRAHFAAEMTKSGTTTQKKDEGEVK